MRRKQEQPVEQADQPSKTIIALRDDRARACPTASLSSSVETRVANSGEEKLMAMAPASGIMLNAMSRKVCEKPWDTERSAWCDRRRVRYTASPVCGKMKIEQVTSATAVRVNRTSPIG